MLAGMSKEDFPVTALLISLAATLAMAAVRQGTKHKALIWSLLVFAAVSAGVGVSWPWIKDDLPRFGAFVGEIAASRVAWFVIGMFGVAALLFRRPRPPSPAPAQSPIEPRHAPVQPDAAMGARVGALEADLVRVAGELRPALKDLAETHKAGAAEVERSVVALREAVRSVSDRAGAEREALERKIADAELVATERIDKAKQLFGRLFDELRGRQDALVRALRARDAARELRELSEAEARLFTKLMRADRADYEGDETGINLIVGWAEDFGAWERSVEDFWRIAAEWGRPFPDLFSISHLEYGMVDGKPPGTIQNFDMEQRWRTVAVVSARHRGRREDAIGAVRTAAVLPPPSPA